MHCGTTGSHSEAAAAHRKPFHKFAEVGEKNVQQKKKRSKLIIAHYAAGYQVLRVVVFELIKLQKNKIKNLYCCSSFLGPQSRRDACC